MPELLGRPRLEPWPGTVRPAAAPEPGMLRLGIGPAPAAPRPGRVDGSLPRSGRHASTDVRPTRADGGRRNAWSSARDRQYHAIARRRCPVSGREGRASLRRSCGRLVNFGDRSRRVDADMRDRLDCPRTQVNRRRLTCGPVRLKPPWGHRMAVLSPHVSGGREGSGARATPAHTTGVLGPRASQVLRPLTGRHKASGGGGNLGLSSPSSCVADRE